MKVFISGLLYFISIVVLVACTSVGQDSVTEEDSLHYYPPTPGKIDKNEFRNYYRQLDTLFDTALIRKGFNGSILIARQGNILYQKNIGYRSFNKKDTITDSTAFHLASTSKPFTAIGALLLVQSQAINLDDTLNRFFPDFPYPGITVQMLLNHRSGLPDYVYFMGDSKKWNVKDTVTNAKMYKFLVESQPKLNYKANTRFYYSNTNYALLAMIIEKVTEMSYPAYMQKYVFEPLQMKDTYVFTPDMAGQVTMSYKVNGKVWDNDHLEWTYGDKNIYSSVRDMLKWDQALYTTQLINAELLEKAFTPYSFEKNGTHNYGLGWRIILEPNGKKVVYHNGRWHGFTPAFTRLIEEQTTIIILGNQYNKNIYTAANLAYNVFGEYNQRKVDIVE